MAHKYTQRVIHRYLNDRSQVEAEGETVSLQGATPQGPAGMVLPLESAHALYETLGLALKTREGATADAKKVEV